MKHTARLRKRKESEIELDDLSPEQKLQRISDRAYSKKVNHRNVIVNEKETTPPKNVDEIAYADALTTEEENSILLKPCAYIDPGKLTLLSLLVLLKTIF